MTGCKGPLTPPRTGPGLAGAQVAAWLPVNRDYSDRAVEFKALNKKTLASIVGAPVETNARTTRDVIMLLHSVILDFSRIDTRNKS